MSDDTCCCGVVGVPGFVPNKANLNRLVVGEEIEYTDAMKAPCSGSVFRGLAQESITVKVVDNSRYDDMMNIASRNKIFLKAMGVMK